MNRSQLSGQIAALEQDLKRLRSVTTNCQHCDWKAWSRPFCNKHNAEIPAEFMHTENCPDWEFDQIPF